MRDFSRFREQANFVALVAAGWLVMICLFGHLGAMGLVGPDEPRYAWIARAMASTGDWVTPRLYGQPWFEKPVLYYWAAGAGFLVHLPAEWAARLPSALAALVTAIAIGWLGVKHYGLRAELFVSPFILAPLIFSTSVAAIGFARAASPDMLFSASLTVGMASAATVLRKGRGLGRYRDPAGSNSISDHRALGMFGAALGLAVLAKGPAGIILAAGAIGIWALLTARWRDASRLTHPIAIAAFCAVALPWYVVCAMRNPDFIHIFIFQHNFERYLTPMFQHRQPFWYFAPILILGLLPWTAGLWSAGEEGRRLWRERAWKNSPGLFFACWAVFPFLFFSFSQSKLPGYILPAIAPLALVISVGLQRRVLTRESSAARGALDDASARGVLAAIGVTWIALGISAAVWAHRLPEAAREAPGMTLTHAAIAGIVAGIAIATLGLLRNRGAILCSFLTVMLLVEIAGARILPALDPYLSARFHGNLLRNDRFPARVFTFNLTRSWEYGLDFYLEREVPKWSPDDPNAALVLTTPQGLEEIRKLGRFQGALDEPYVGILYVPVLPAPR